MAFALIFECPNCGDVWHVHTVEQSDDEHDEVYAWKVCVMCGADVKPKLVDGKPVYHALSEEEIEAETLYGACNDEDFDW